MPDSRRERIQISDRDVDNGYDAIGYHLSLKDDYLSSVKVTEKHSSARKTEIDHHNRIKEFIEWIEISYPDYYDIGVKELTLSHKANKELYCKSTHNLICNSFNTNMFKSFLAAEKWKTKKDRTKAQFSFAHMRKYKDAILHGAK